MTDLQTRLNRYADAEEGNAERETNILRKQMLRVRAEAMREAARKLDEAALPKDEQIKVMVSRFLQWKLPEDFSPDGGISFKGTFNEITGKVMRFEPVGTNLFTATQAEAMIRHMLGEAPV